MRLSPKNGLLICGFLLLLLLLKKNQVLCMCDPVPDQVTLPGQQGPQATFPYHYQQLLKDDLDRGIEQPKKQNSTSSTPILSSMLAARPDRPHLQGTLGFAAGVELSLTNLFSRSIGTR